MLLIYSYIREIYWENYFDDTSFRTTLCIKTVELNRFHVEVYSPIV